MSIIYMHTQYSYIRVNYRNTSPAVNLLHLRHVSVSMYADIIYAISAEKRLP